MDVSSRELRDTDIKEAFRGYSRDDVDELLERAAGTIEGLSERVRQMSERVAEAETGAGRSRDAEETLQRTLVLAQRTADEAVADAQQRARKMLDDAESRARTLVSDAEANAMRIADEQKRRLEAEVLDLASRRDKLSSDVDALERFASDYRRRVRSAIEAELETLGSIEAEKPPRPELHEVDPPAPAEETGAPRIAEPPPPVGAEPPLRDPFASVEDATPSPAPVTGGEDVPLPETVAPAAAPSPADSEGLAAFVSDEPIEAEVLDDDAFFASLREAVRDDAPLGPRDDAAAAATHTFFDQDEAEAGRRRFRRRR